MMLGLAVLNESMEPSQNAAQGSRLTVQATIGSTADKQESLVYTVQIKDPEERVIFISSTVVILDRAETRTMESLWSVQAEGDYTIQVFVWQNVEPPQTFSYSSTHLNVVSVSEPEIDCTGSASCFRGLVMLVIDGDTIDVNDVRVRLALIDTPERGEAGYQEATTFTSTLCAEGSEVLVDEDDGQRSGSYGRMVAKVYCGGKLINEELLRSQNAIILTGHCNESEFGQEEWATRYGC